MLCQENECVLLLLLFLDTLYSHTILNSIQQFLKIGLCDYELK